MPFRVLGREVETLNGQPALAECRDMISVELVSDKNKLEAWGLFKDVRAKFF